MKSIETMIHHSLEQDLMPGAEPFFFERGRVGCLLLHGFGGTPAVTRHPGQRLAEAGITAWGPLLPGHGTRSEDMLPYTAYDWVRAAVDSLHLLAERCSAVFVMGLSMGGALTVHLGATQGDRLRGIIPVNAAAVPREIGGALEVVQAGAPEMVPGWWEQPMTKDPSVEYAYYEAYPGRAVFSLFGLLKINEELLPDITVPTLILHSRDDAVTPPVHAETLYARIRSMDKQLRWLENSYHVSTLDYDKDRIADEMIGFIEERA